MGKKQFDGKLWDANAMKTLRVDEQKW